jgi:hypothetical protein
MKTNYSTGSTAVNRELKAAAEKRPHCIDNMPLYRHRFERRSTPAKTGKVDLQLYAAIVGVVSIVGSVIACALVFGVCG